MIWLALIAVVEAIVYQARYRSAVLGGPFVAAWWTLLTQTLRVAWLAIGVGELMHGADLVLVIAAYGFPAAIAVGVMRAMEHRREHRPALWATDNPNPAPAGSPPISQVRPHATFTMFNSFLVDQERADAEKWSASRIGPTNTERRS